MKKLSIAAVLALVAAALVYAGGPRYDCCERVGRLKTGLMLAISADGPGRTQRYEQVLKKAGFDCRWNVGTYECR